MGAKVGNGVVTNSVVVADVVALLPDVGRMVGNSVGVPVLDAVVGEKVGDCVGSSSPVLSEVGTKVCDSVVVSSNVGPKVGDCVG